MRKTFTHLCLMVAMLLIGTTSAFAQFEGRVQQYPTTDYSTSPITFKLTEVAAALETDTATLAASLNSQTIKFLLSYEGETTDQYSANGMGFWMTTEGARVAYADGHWFAETSWDTESDALTFSLGQMPNYFTKTTATNATFVLQNNGKEVTFKIGLDVYKPEIEVMADTINKAEVTSIVKEYTINVHQFPRSNTNSDLVEIDLKEGLAALGITSADLAPSLSDVLYTQYISELSGAPIAVDSLHNTSSEQMTAPGWWFQPAMIEDAEDEAYTTESYSFATSTGSKFYIHGFSLDAENDTLYSYIGQNAGVLAANDSLTASVYIVYKGQAVKLNYQLVIDESEDVPFEEMIEAGKIEIDVQQYVRSAYNTDAFDIDVNAIAEALGCTVGDYQIQSLAAEGVLSTNTTANNGGYWFNKEGYIGTWGDAAAIFIEPTSSEYSTINVGQMPGNLPEGFKQTYRLYFTFGAKYYLVQVNFEILVKEAIEFTVVSTEALNIWIKPHTDYTYDGCEASIDMEYLAGLIGESDNYTFYTLDAPILASDGSDSIPAKLTDAYNCDPNPGFWMGMDGYRGSWGANASYGITWGNLGEGKFQLYQMPSNRQEGDTYHSTFYLMNPANGKAVEYATTVKFTSEELVEAEVVGHEDVVVVLGKDATTVDLAPAIAALGYSADEIYNGAFVGVRQTSATYTDLNDGGVYGWYLNDEGFWVDYESDEAALCNVALLQEWDENNLTFFADSPSGNGLADGVVVDTKVCVEYEAKQYIYNIKIMNENTSTGIQGIETNSKVAGNVYDISGRIVRKNATSVNGLANGIYILNGKKYIAK